MIVTLDSKEIRAFCKMQDMLRRASTPPPVFFDWVADRLVKVHGESEIVDYVQKLREYARDTAEICGYLNIRTTDP